MTKILIDRSTVEQALEALEAGPDVDPIFAGETEDALRAALAEPVQEPVADRAAFERHAERLGYSVDPDTREGRKGGYWSSHTQLMWLTWQAALAEPVQEPVAWVTVRLNVPIQTTARKDVADEWLKWGEVLPLYTSPPQRKPLTDDAMQKVFTDSFGLCPEPGGFLFRVGRAVEAAHKIGGEG